MTPDRLSSCIYVSERDECPWVRPTELDLTVLRRPVVLTNGGFDLLHSGHMKIFFRARRHAGTGTIICALDSDARCARKDPSRPIQTFIERATTLGYMPIDYICEIETDADMRDLICTVRPDLRVQGADYRHHITKYPQVPRLIVAGVTKSGERLGQSTTKIIQRVLQRCGKE